MTRRLVLALAAWGVLAPMAAGQMLYPARILPTREALGRLGLERAWFTAVPLQAGVERILKISFAGGMVFAQTTEAQLHAFDAESGRWLWSTQLGRPTLEAQEVAVNSRFAFATNGQHLFCLDLGTGRIIWDQKAESYVTSPASATEELVTIGEANGKAVAYSLVPASDPRFRRQAGPPGGFAWAYSTNGPITARIIPTSQVVAFASTAGKLYVARLDPKEMLHRSQPLGSIEGSMGTFGTGPQSTLFVPSTNGNLYAINLFTGEQEWVFSSGAPIRTQPLVGSARAASRPSAIGARTEVLGEDQPASSPGGPLPSATPGGEADVAATLFILNDLGVLHSVDALTGEPVWGPDGCRTGARKILAVGASRLYLQTEYADLVVVDRATGALVSSGSASRGRAGLDLRDYRFSVINDVNDRIYLASDFGSLICIREQGALRPTPVRDPNEPAFGEISEETLTQTPPAVPEAGGSSGEGGFGLGGNP